MKATALNRRGAEDAKGKLPKPLPCPFCGAKPKLDLNKDHLPEITKEYWSISCPGRPIPCSGHPISFGDTPREAVGKWNLRRPLGEVIFQVIGYKGKSATVEGSVYDTEDEACDFIRANPRLVRTVEKLKVIRMETVTVAVVKGGAR